MNIQVLYIGGLTEGKTGYRKFLELKKEVSKLDYINSDVYKDKRGVIGSLNHRGIINNLKKELNESILSYVYSKKYDLIYFSKADWIFPETLIKLKEHTSLLIHYTPDAAFKYNQTPEFTKGAKYYNYLLTTKEWEINDYVDAVGSAEKIILTHQGVDVEYFKPDKSIPKTTDTVFIGRKEKHYENILETIFRNSIDLSVYGNQWIKTKFFNKKRAFVKGGNLIGKEYVSKLNSTKIALGLLSKLFPETTTTRTYEITACGTLLLAERTERHLSLFEEDKEAIFFSNYEELIDKIRYYLKNDTLREKIAYEGRLRCVNSGYSNDEIVKLILGLVNENR